MDIAELSMLLEGLSSTQVSPLEFQAAADKAKTIKDLDNEHQLLLYGLYKQSTIGDVNVPQPSSLNFVAARKWKAWNSYKGFPQKNAALAYVYIVNQMLTGNMDFSADGTDSDSNFMDIFGSVTVSTLNKQYDDSQSWSSSEALFQAVVDKDIEALKSQTADKSTNINCKNEEGMTPLHFAADRGFPEGVQHLISIGADVNLLDNSNQTPLMYAVICDHKDVVSMLLEFGADITIKDSDGLTVDKFDDISNEVQELLNNASTTK